MDMAARIEATERIVVPPAAAAPSAPAARLPHMLGIQYLRGAAALGVVVFHASQAAGYGLEAGAFGVDVFFVLSGFLMIAITGEHSRPWPFLRERMRRIVPPYWIASVAALCLGAAGLFWTPSRLQALASFAFVPYGPAEGAPYYYPVLTVGWTLNYEMFFYAAFAASLALPHKARLPALTVLFAALVAARPLLGANAAAPLLFWSDSLLLEFLAGAWVGALWRRDAPYRPGLAPALAAAGVASFVLLRLEWLPQIAPGRLPLAVPAVLLLLAALEAERRPGGIVRSRFAALLGDASYSIYLWHVFAIGGAVLAARALGLPEWTVFPAGLGGGVLLGIAAWRAVEVPLLAARRRRG